MIQRIQSVYLGGVFIMSALLFFIPFGTIGEYVVTATQIANGEEVVKSTTPLAVLIVAAAALALVTTFMFKNRKLQMKLCSLTMIMQAVVMAMTLFMYIDPTAKELGIEEVSYGIGTYLPIGGMVLAFLASKAIKKDDDLVNSVDRIR